MAQDQLSGVEVSPNRKALDDLLATGGGISLWGIAPTAPLHFGYDSLIVAQHELVALGLKHIILLADFHAMLSHGYAFDEISRRATYYENYLRHCCGISALFVRGSSFQSRPHYVESLYSAMSSLPISKARDSLAKVSKGSGADTTKVSAYMYGLMQCLDCCYLGAKIIFAEHGQAKIYELLDSFPGDKLAGRERFGQGQGADGKPLVFLYAPTGYDIKGQPLNLSAQKTRISIHESEESLKGKINEMVAAPPGQPLPPNRANALLEFFRNSVFPWRSAPVGIKDREGVMRSYSDYLAFVTDYNNGWLHPKDCKDSLFGCLSERLHRIQAEMGSCICDWVKPAPDVQKQADS